MKIAVAAIISAVTASAPIRSSESISDRVRGMDLTSRCGGHLRGRSLLERLQVRISGRAQLGRRPLERDASVAQHDELRLLDLLAAGRHDPDGAALTHGGV